MDSTLQAVLAAAASFLFITVIFACLCAICKPTSKAASRHHHPRRRGLHDHHAHHHINTRTVSNPSELSSITVDESASFDPTLHQISMEELKLATKNFSRDLIIGDGGFGLVYKAHLYNGATVAIKKLGPDAFQGFREFRAEMDTLGKLRHKNIVKILGYCISGSDRVLIYEFMEKGSVDQWLHDASLSGEQSVKLPLPWETRVKVVRDVANGLAFMHGLDTPIVHRDIKASNVLLDKNFEAHIADFGLARMIDASHTHVSTQVAGTMGYMPPEYKDGVTAATAKADVYSFGVLMFEIMTGERPNLPKVLDGKEVGLIQWARKMVGQNRHMEMLDRSMPRGGLKEDEVKEYFGIASMCTEEVNSERPLIAEVVALLKDLSS